MKQMQRNCRAKLPGADSGIEIRKTMCDICTPGPQCGVDAYIKDGVLVKVEGTKGFPSNDGALCAKGQAMRQYIYRKDRIRTPMRRVGPKGDPNSFVPISWDEAIQETASRLLEVREKYGAPSVVFGCGYPKWFRAWLERLAHSFGSPNYFTESSTCNSSGVMAARSMFGSPAAGDLGGGKLLLCWANNGIINSFPMGRGTAAFKARGGKIVVIDARRTPTAQMFADLFIQPKSGTDAVLAHAVAKLLIENDWYDREYVEKYVHGFEQYREYVCQFDLPYAEKVTGVPSEQIVQLAQLLHEIHPATLLYGTGIGHHMNGFNIYRSIYSLLAITGNFDVPGGVLPQPGDLFAELECGFGSRGEEFLNETRPDTVPAVGAEKFPLWDVLMRQAQGVEFARQVLTGKPYELHGAVLFGLNHRMFPESGKILQALDQLDFVVSTDLFLTQACLHSDIILPACSSLERGEAKCYGARLVNYTKPVIEPLYESRDDVSIMVDLARAMQLDDELLCNGYRACVEYMFAPSGIEDFDAVIASDLPVPAPNAVPVIPGEKLKHGLPTPTGKIELYSELIAGLHCDALDPLPVYAEPTDPGDPEQFPMVLMAGARLPNALHSRMHTVAWTRALRPEVMADLNPDDAQQLGICQGDEIVLETAIGTLNVKANLTWLTGRGHVQFYHDYPEANVNDVIPDTMLDPYTGFPSYKQVRCRVSKCGGGM